MKHRLSKLLLKVLRHSAAAMAKSPEWLIGLARRTLPDKNLHFHADKLIRSVHRQTPGVQVQLIIHTGNTDIGV